MTITPFFNAVVSQINRREGEKATLNPDKQDHYDKKRKKLLDRFSDDELSDKCKELLAKTGKTLKEIMEAVQLQRPYDGEESTITRFDAGLFSEIDVEPGAPKYLVNIERTQRVNEYFKQHPGLGAATATHPGGVLGKTVLERSDVYFRPSEINEKNILHEALHSVTGLGDIDLYKLFTGKKAETIEEASNGIRLLVKNKCVR